MPDYSSKESLPVEFTEAAQQGAPPIARNQAMVPIDADLIAYFQGETEPSDWRGHINGVLRFYMDTNMARDADFQAALAAAPAEGPGI